MVKKDIEIRLILSTNIRKYRKLLDLSQEKLSEMAGISSNMVRDIENCRTWVSDTTLTNIANALEIDIYRLLMPETANEAENYQTVLLELTRTFKKLRKEFDFTLENTLKGWKVKIQNPQKP
jgi:transcriptional regulator with XRE-family HTH domain